MKTILLRFNGLLQSWGTNPTYQNHETNDCPTKSAVVGLIAAALGRERGEDISDLASLKMGVRVDNPGQILSDFQRMGYNYKKSNDVRRDNPQRIDRITGEYIPIGKGAKPIKDSTNNKISTRYYLTGADFLCGLEGEDELIDEIAYAVRHPQFPLSLGRRCCPATADLFVGITDKSLEDAIAKEDASQRIILEVEAGGDRYEQDVPLGNCTYTYRMVKEQ